MSYWSLFFPLLVDNHKADSTQRGYDATDRWPNEMNFYINLIIFFLFGLKIAGNISHDGHNLEKKNHTLQSFLDILIWKSCTSLL